MDVNGSHTLLTKEEKSEVLDFIYYLDVGHFVRMQFTFYYPIYTFPVLIFCEDCVRTICVNYSVMTVIEYLTPSDLAKINLHMYFCSFCRTPLYTFCNE